MSCKMSGSCESDVDVEPVNRLLNVGRPMPLRKPPNRHFINPNFMFFCQIVLLIIPITILYAGLYFMNISSNVIVLICGAIVLVILCIFVFLRPFKEEKCVEKKPLRQSYEYTPFKKIDDPAAMGSVRPKRTKCHSDDEVAGEEEDGECTFHAKNPSNDTLLSIATSNFSESATQTKICSEDIPIERTHPSATNTAPFFKDEEKFGNSLTMKSEKAPMDDSDGGTWDTRGSLRAENNTLTHSLGVIEEEGETSRHISLTHSPCSESQYHAAKLLSPDVALSGTTRPTSTNQSRTESCSKPYLDPTHPQHLSQPSNGQTITGYTSQESSAHIYNKANPSPSKYSKQPGPHKTRENFTQAPTCDSEQSNTEHSENMKHGSAHLTCSNTIPTPSYRNQNKFYPTHPASRQLPPTSTNVCQTFRQPKLINRQSLDSHHSNLDSYRSIREQEEVICANKLCPFTPTNQTSSQVVSQTSTDPNNSGSSYPYKTPPEKPITPEQKKRRGYLDNVQDVVKSLPHEGGDVIPDYPKKQSNNLSKEPAFQTIKFQHCQGDRSMKTQICSTGDNNSKQPILIKLYPTSSKDGMFLWESMPLTSKTGEAHRLIQNGDNLKEQLITTDEYVQTTRPEMVDTQTSAVFPTTGKQEHSIFNDSIPAQLQNKMLQQKGSHKTKSGSMVDFVLRPFSKVTQILHPPLDVKGRGKRCRKVKRNDDGNYQEKGQPSQDPSQFDLLRVQPRYRNDYKTSGYEKGGNAQPKSPTKKGSSPPKERTGKLDICSIYYSSITGKLFQPTKSGLLVTESSKETVEKKPKCIELSKMFEVESHNASNTDHYRQQPHPNHWQNCKGNRICSENKMPLKSTKRKSDEHIKSKQKCAKHTDSEAVKTERNCGTETMLPWAEIAETHGRTPMHDSDLKSKITFMYPPFNLDFSSEPCEDISKASSDHIHTKETTGTKAMPIDKRVSKKPPSQGVQRQSKHKNRRVSHQTETTLFKKSSSSYENVVIEKVVKQKKRTLKKFR